MNGAAVRPGTMAVLLALASGLTLRATETEFDRTVAPVLIEHCLDCHSGPKPKGSVDLTTVAAIMKGKRGKPILRPGDPAASSVFTSVEDGTMPPEGKAPSEAEKRLIRDWILGGAK